MIKKAGFDIGKSCWRHITYCHII